LPKPWKADRDPFALETSTPGIFAVGDVRSGSVKRVASSVGEGSVVVSAVWSHLDAIDRASRVVVPPPMPATAV